MKITKTLLFGFALIAGLATASAQDNLTAVLKDGSELTGYISHQRPGESFTFTTSKATIMLPATMAKSMVDNDVLYSSLSDEWKLWADAHDATVGNGDNRKVTLSDIITDNGTITRVRILERGAKIKYLELTPNSYSLTWDTLALIRCDHRPKLLLSGVNRKYKLKSGMEYEGQYVEEIPGETVSLYRDNGIVEVFHTIDVVKDNRVKVNPNQTLIEQSDLIDIIKLNNGTTYRGIIIERNYFGFDDMDSVAIAKSNNRLIQHDYLLMQLGNESTISVNLSDIAEYCKEPNPKYAPLTDIILNQGEYVINRINATVQEPKDADNLITINTDSLNIAIPKGSLKTTISLESKFDNALQSQQFKLIRAHKYQAKKTKEYFYAFTYEDLVKTALLPIKSETSVNGTTKLDFDVFSTGIYVFYNPITNEAIPFRIK
jgi:hypothetical protein